MRAKLLTPDVIHNWFDADHITPFKAKNVDSMNDRLHTSVDSFIKTQMKKFPSFVDTKELTDLIKKKHPMLFKHFLPTQDQLVFFLVTYGLPIKNANLTSPLPQQE